MYCLLVVGL